MLRDKLIERGVTNAEELLRKHSRNRVSQAIANFDDRLAHGEDLGPGWLGSCITRKEAYGFRKGYVSAETRARRAERSAEATSRYKESVKSLLDREEAASKREKAAFDAFYESLKRTEQEAFRREAVRTNSAFRELLKRPTEHEEHYARAAMLSLWRKRSQK